jgi:hypothetical protein
MVCGPTNALDSRNESGGDALLKVMFAQLAALPALYERCNVPSVL